MCTRPLLLLPQQFLQAAIDLCEQHERKRCELVKGMWLRCAEAVVLAARLAASLFNRTRSSHSSGAGLGSPLVEAAGS